MADPFDPHLRAAMLAQLAELRLAGLSFDRICALPGWPSRPTLRKWLRQGAGPEPPALRRGPVRWSRPLANHICRRILGGESLREICRDPAMPDRKTLDLWRRTRPRFAARLADARIRSGHARTGRHTTYCPVVMQQIFDHLAAGGTLAGICAAPGMPAPRTVRDWARADPDVARTLDLGRQIWRERRAEAFFPMLAAMEAEVKARKAREGPFALANAPGPGTRKPVPATPCARGPAVR